LRSEFKLQFADFRQRSEAKISALQICRVEAETCAALVSAGKLKFEL
jgi:hypothetical protein